MQGHDEEVQPPREPGEDLRAAADLSGSGKKDEDVAGGDLVDGAQGLPRGPFRKRPGLHAVRVPDLDGVARGSCLDDRSAPPVAAEERGDRSRIERGGSDEQPEVVADRRADLDRHRQDEVRLAAALVELVQHHGRHARQGRVREQLPRQDPFRRHDDPRGSREGRTVPRDESDRPADRLPELFGHPAGRGPGGAPPRLQEPERPVAEEPRLEDRERETGRLPAPRGRGHHDRAGPGEGRQDGRDPRVDRKRRSQPGEHRESAEEPVPGRRNRRGVVPFLHAGMHQGYVRNGIAVLRCPRRRRPKRWARSLGRPPESAPGATRNVPECVQA